MNTFAVRWRVAVPLLGVLAVGLAACVGYGGGGSYSGGYAGAPGLGYYEPYGVDYGGWGNGYRVAPFRGGHQGGGRGRMPSLPSGGGHAGGHGGGRGGGGGGHGGGGRR